MQRAVASSSKRMTMRFADLRRRRYWFPLMVDSIVLNILILAFLAFIFLLSFCYKLIIMNFIENLFGTDRNWITSSAANKWHKWCLILFQ